MNGQIKRGQSRRKASHKIAHFCHKKWKKCCAAALCVTVAASNLTGTFSAEAKSDTYNFELSRESLDEALQEALYDGATVTEEDFIFEGSSADDYVSLMNTDTALYELKPEIKENDEDLVLRVFARVDGDLVTNEDFTNEVYELNEEDEIIFLLENRSAEEQKAVIQVDDRTSEVITVMPAGKIQVESDGPGGANSAEKATDPAEGGPGVIDGGSGNGGGGGGSTPAPEVPEEPSSEAPTEESTEAGSEETTAPEESDPSETTEAEEPTQPAEPADPTDSTDAPEESEDSGSGDTTTDPSEDAGDNGGNAPDAGDGSDTGTDPGTDGGQETGTDGGSTSDTDTGSSTDEGTDAGNDSGSEAGSSDTSTGGDTSSDSGSQSSDTSDSSDSEGSSDTSGEGASMASISLREFRLVATAAGTETTEAAESTEAADTETEESKEEESKAEETLESEEETSEETTASDETKAPEETTASDETKAPEETTAAEETTAPEETSEAGGDSEVVVEEPDSATSSEADKDDAEEATPSEASPSEADKNSIEGDIYEAVKVGDYAVVAFATTAGEVGLTELPPEIFAKELKDVTVEAVAERGVFPIGTTMDVMALGEDTAEYENAKEALKAEGTESTGMLAYDISFKNMAGEEIEPVGEVNVSIRLSTDLLPEDADLDSLTVHHMAEESANVIKAEAVADTGNKTDGTVDMVANEAIATFSVESFSTFVITFEENASSDNKLQFKILDADLQELQVPSDYDLSYTVRTTGEKEYIKNIIEKNGVSTITIEGTEYVYKNAYFNVDGSWQFIDSVACVSASGKNQIRLYRPDEGGDAFYTRQYGSDCEVGLLYQKQEDIDTGEVQTEVELKRSKTATLKSDGTYDLELTLSGQVGSINEKVPVDITFVVDQSGSMKEGNRNIIVGQQVANLTKNLAKNENIDVRYSVVGFSSDIVTQEYYRDAAMRQYWTRDLDAVENAATIQYPTGGTNYEAGLKVTKELLEGTRASAQKYVIFLSDGAPTYHYNSNGVTEGGGNSTSDTDISNAQVAAKKLTNLNGFFSIRVGDERNADKYLQQVCDAAHVGSAAAPAENFTNYQAEESDDLAKVFEQIAGQITQVLCSNVTITDTLSQYVKAVAGATPVVKVLDKNGSEISRTGITASLTDGVLTVNFPSEYRLQPGYTYKVNLNIEPSTKAYSEYSEKGYLHTGENSTGTHSGEGGFFSNDNAEVTYTYNDINQKNEYPKPVIQLQTVNVTLKKVVDGNAADLEKKFRFTYKINEVPATDPISLGNGESKTISIKKGSKLEIVEDSEGYDVTIACREVPNTNTSGTSGTYVGVIYSNAEITFTNIKAIDTPTGVTTEILPYGLMVAAGVLGATGFKLKGRRKDDDD